MLKKTSGTAGAVGSSPVAPGLMGCELARHSNGGRPSSPLLLSPRSLSSLFSMDAPAMPEESKNQPRSSPRNPTNGHPRGAGLAAVLIAGEDEWEHRPNGRVLLGMRLRVQLPPVNGLSGDLPSSPIEFGVKNRDSQLALLSPVQRSPLSSAAARAARSEVEALAEEDYTCVIARGPNPKMTHIFDDRVVESCAGDGCCQLSYACYGCKCNRDRGKATMLPSCSIETRTKFCSSPIQLPGSVKGSAIHRSVTEKLKP